MVCYRHIDGEREKGVRGMEKLRMKTESIVDSNVEKLKELFPNCVVETLDENGQGTKRVDFDLLKQELSKELIDENKERYQMTWPNKKQAVLKANTEIAKTLRPCREESEDYDNTENIYIEGDNLDVLKVLRQTYMHKVKMIYIDPPYNTGNDFIYKDNYSKDREEYLEESGQVDEDGNRMFKNPESNGRFHTDWLNMIYPRLRVAKDLLTDDGVIFISIDDNEQANLKKVCDEIFGESNFICKFIWEKTVNPNSTFNNIGVVHEYILCYSKTLTQLNQLALSKNEIKEYTGYDDFIEERGPYKLVGLNKTGTVNDLRPNLIYDIIAPNGIIIKPNPRWRWSQEKYIQGLQEDRIVFRQLGEKWTVYYKQYLFEDTYGNKIQRGSLIKTIISDCGRTTNGSLESTSLLGKGLFDFPKPIKLITRLIKISTSKNDIILDFFSGSATTAHAVMQLNAEDSGNRKFIMVQLPEKCDEKSEAYKAGYKNICEIGKERIRRAGKKIKEENANATNIDTGFRVFKLDSSNMKDCYYYPEDTTQDMLEKLQDNIKEDRTAEDLLIQVMLELEVELSSKIETVEIKGKKVYKVNEKELVCCFERNLTNAIVTEIAKMQPEYVVFRDSSMQSDSVNINFEQLFKSYSPNTIRKVL